jgi:hypothetical protein
MKTVAFWHCFGSYGEESREDILKRKRDEISRNGGWTLWSFSHKLDTTLELWLSQIKSIGAKRVFVLCSASKNPKNPGNDETSTRNAREYKSPHWRHIPAEVKVPHVFRNRSGTASAFVVKKIILPDVKLHIPPKGFKWLNPWLPIWRPTVKFQWLNVKDGKWHSDRKPDGRLGEYLVKEGKGVMLQSIHAVLELKYPYVVQIRK